MARAGIDTQVDGPKIPLDANEPTASKIKSQKYARSAAGVEPTTFQTAATDSDKGWRLYRNGHDDL